MPNIHKVFTKAAFNTTTYSHQVERLRDSNNKATGCRQIFTEVLLICQTFIKCSLKSASNTNEIFTPACLHIFLLHIKTACLVTSCPFNKHGWIYILQGKSNIFIAYEILTYALKVHFLSVKFFHRYCRAEQFQLCD